jgi:hypothetical protein
MPLRSFHCDGTDVSSLEPLRGAPLETLGCSSCRIRSLEPLQGMPLTHLKCQSNQIDSLAPLRGLPLTALYCDGNEVSDLEPLRGMFLEYLICAHNRISSLEPIRHRTPESLLCNSNPLTSLEPFVEKPPGTFYFDSPTLSLSELERLRTLWSSREQTVHLARQVEFLIAARSEGSGSLKALARSFKSHAYLFVPIPMTWEQARAWCQERGGHLVTITSAEENTFVGSLVPQEETTWLGFVSQRERHQWVTGEPFRFEAFVDRHSRRMTGSGFWTRGKWGSDPYPSARAPFIIEWER